jgi:hypothetical protein
MYGTVAAVVGILLVLLMLGLTLGKRDGLLGTWKSNGREGPAGYTWSDDGTGRRYARIYVSADSGSGQRLDSLMVDLGPFVIEDRWTGSGGDTWYKVKTWWSSLNAPRYALIRLDTSGNSYESDESLDGYPASLGGRVGTGMHQRYERQ